jgi:two-component system sensor histidine kinase RegB
MIDTMKLLLQLRGMAIMFQFIALAAMLFLHLPVHFTWIFFFLGLQIVIFIITFSFLKKQYFFSENHIFLQLFFDLLALTVFVVSCGGMANPFSGLFLIQAILAALLLSSRKTWIMIGMTATAYVVLLIQVNPLDEDHMAWMKFHLYGMTINHLLSTAVIGFFVVKIVANLRLRERQISARHGLVGVGAFSAQIAHKIGTPLNKIALVADDLSSISLQKDKAYILDAVLESKGYLSELFKRLSRLEQVQNTASFSQMMDQFLLWISARFPMLKVSCKAVDSLEFLNNEILELVFLLLELFSENAAEAGAKHVDIVFLKEKNLRILIQNDGPPIEDTIKILMTLGYCKKSGMPHAGIGLFLAHLIITSLGGSVTLHENNPVSMEVFIPLDR